MENQFESRLIKRYSNLIVNLKDGKSVKVRRETVVNGVTKPMGTITRQGKIIIFEPAKSMRVKQTKRMMEEKAARELADVELLSAFSF